MLYVNFMQYIFFNVNKEKYVGVGPVKFLQDQEILDGTGPTGPVPF